VFFHQFVRPDKYENILATDDHSAFRPTGGLAVLLLFFFLNLHPHEGRTWRQHVAEFDFLGLLLLVAGVVCLLIGFNSSEISC
jgi:hypothetical protein